MNNRETGESFHASTRTRKELIRTRTLFDAAHEAGLVTAAFCWPATRGDDAVDFDILHGHSDVDPDEVDPELLESLRRAGIPIDIFIDSYADWGGYDRMSRGHRDAILASAAAEVIRTHRPALTAVHLTVTDAMQHDWGPDHYLAHAALTRADHNVGLLREAVQEAGLEDRTTFIIVSDHGFHSLNHAVNIHPVLHAGGLADRVRLHGGGRSVFVETTDDFDQNRDGQQLESFFEDVLHLDGVHRIIRDEDFHALGYPRYEESPYVPGQHLIIPDIDTYLEVASESGSTERRLRTSPSHGHGYLPDHPRMHTAMVLSGYGIREGHRLGRVRNQDVAPTIANLLGLDMPDVDGQVLREALTD